jgi:hypothetical protein
VALQIKEIRLTKIRTDLGKSDLSLYSAACAKFYNPTEHLAVDKIAVLFIGRVIFKQYVLKKHK